MFDLAHPKSDTLVASAVTVYAIHKLHQHGLKLLSRNTKTLFFNFQNVSSKNTSIFHVYW